MEPFSQQKDSVWLEPLRRTDAGKYAIVAGVSTRCNGVSKPPFQSLNTGFHVKDSLEAVQENRRRIGETIGYPVDSWVGAVQVHKNHIERVNQSHRGKGAMDYISAIPDTDGLYTTEPNILLTMNYADCVPLSFYSKSHDAVGIAHAGWRGTVLNIGSQMIEIWENNLHIPPEEVHVMIGPSIGHCCYEVDQKVADEVKAILPEHLSMVAAAKGQGKYDLNLQALNRLLLIKAGVPDENIHVSSSCTSCSNDVFFSHRKEKGRTGRILGFIGMKKES